MTVRALWPSWGEVPRWCIPRWGGAPRRGKVPWWYFASAVYFAQRPHRMLKAETNTNEKRLGELGPQMRN